MSPHILLLIATLLVGCSVAPVDPLQVVPYKRVGDVELSLHIFSPPGHRASERRPAIVFFFGGGWNGGSPSQFFPQSEYLAARGMVSICAEYRVKKQHGTTPQECVKDGKSAIRWVRANARLLGIDHDRIAAGGGSAGGHVAAATATTDGFNQDGEDLSISCRPDALVLFNPVIDNSAEGYGYQRVKNFWQQFSPMHNISESTPPTIFFLGTNDSLIPVATAKEYKRRMESHGQRCDLHLYDGEGHGFFNKSKYDETVLEMDRFLTSLGFLEPTPNHSQ